MSWNLKKQSYVCEVWNLQPIEFPLSKMKLEDSRFKTIQTKKLVDWSLDEEKQPVVVVKISSNTAKHQAFTKLSAVWAYQAFEEGIGAKEDMVIETSCTKTKLLVETLTGQIPTVAALRDQSDQYSIFS